MDLKTCQLFEGFSEQQYERFVTVTETRDLEKHEWIFHEGEPADRLYCIQTGAVELLTRLDERVELPITILRAKGSHFGTSSLVEPYSYSLSARTYEKSTLRVVQRDRLMRLVEQDPGMGFILMQNLATIFLSRLKETRQEVKIHFKTLFQVMRY
ncbi:MAG: cyclic nucleotide-binding domain-containing protein [Deltaproteobacteria bacterium]